MTFETAVAELHEKAFLKEFTFSTATFVPPNATEVELADSIVSIESDMALLQLKERLPGQATIITPAQERNWFRRKVLREATRQLRDTMSYLTNLQSVRVTNQRGVAIDLRLMQGRRAHLIILYRATNLLPADCQSAKHYASRSIGFVHLFDSVNYLNVVTTLVTPREFFDYLAFRQEIITKWGNLAGQSEKSLLGQFLSGYDAEPPNSQFSEFVDSLIPQKDAWDLGEMLRRYADQIVTPDLEPDAYYPILLEIAQLGRSELRPFKERFMNTVNDAKEGRIVRPYRMAIPRTNCGFVFTSFSSGQVPSAREALLLLTQAHKYEQKLQKCVGVAVWRDGIEYEILWSFVDSAWKFDAEMERFVSESGVLSSVRTVEVPRYEFQARGVDV